MGVFSGKSVVPKGHTCRLMPSGEAVLARCQAAVEMRAGAGVGRGRGRGKHTLQTFLG